MQRKYQMTRVRSGYYLLPSNDGRTLWRVHRYWEDGSAERLDGSTIKGWFWMADYWHGTMDDVQRALDRDGDDFLYDDRWWCDAMLLRTRRDAVEYALTASERIAAAREP